MAIEPDAKRRAHQWREEVYSRQPERDALFETISGQPIEPLYTEEDLAGRDTDRELGFPGEYPYTRGVYPSMYRGRLWTMRQFAGFGTADETNERFRYLLDHGQTGLSTAFDMPTLMGLDSSDGRSRGEPARLLRLRRGGAGDPARGAGRDDPDRHPEGVHRPEGVVLPDRSRHAPGDGHDRVVHRADASVAPHLDLRLPHPRGRLHRPAGARVHAQGRVHVCEEAIARGL